MQRDAVTIRLPNDLLCRAKEAKNEGESLNDLVVSALEREVRRRQGLQVLEEIRRLRDEIEAKHGLHPSSVPLIRALREGVGRRE
ncbi:MAG: hypothetical protein HYY05_04905 [Chloroflexi bacterium]|nr:hypothetical protein [Chloroflexota bacterium]